MALDFDWVYTKEELDYQKANECFTILASRRDLRENTVKKLHGMLISGKHFDTPFMVNEKDGKYRLLDGNHRIEAIKRYLRHNNGKKVVVGICKYRDLSPDEERNMFTKWNLGTKQNASDFLKQYWNKIPLTSKLLKSSGFPVDVGYKATEKTMDFRLLTVGYLAWKSPTRLSHIGYYGNAIDFVEASKDLEEQDCRILKAFMKDYIEVFGLPSKKSHYYRTTVYLSIQRIWLNNFKTIGFDKMKAKLMKLLGHERVIYWRQFGPQRGVVDKVMVDFLEVMNANCKQEKNLLL